MTWKYFRYASISRLSCSRREMWNDDCSAMPRNTKWRSFRLWRRLRIIDETQRHRHWHRLRLRESSSSPTRNIMTFRWHADYQTSSRWCKTFSLWDEIDEMTDIDYFTMQSRADIDAIIDKHCRRHHFRWVSKYFWWHFLERPLRCREVADFSP